MTNVYKFTDGLRGLEPNCKISSGKHSKNPPVIIIDNGSYECRAGISTSTAPDMVFKNVALRQKGKNNEPDTILVGRDIENLETVRNQLKSSFDRNVVTQFDTQEMICDYVFGKLGVDSEECVEYPVLLSEPVANPNHCRKFMSELMFECYSVPKLSYFTDAMSSWYQTYKTSSMSDTGVMICIGYQMSHVVPVIQGQIDMENVRRVAVGGYHLDYFMQRLLQLKYPIHASTISLSRSEEVVQSHTQVASDYKELCQQWTDIPYYDKMVYTAFHYITCLPIWKSIKILHFVCTKYPAYNLYSPADLK